MSRPKQTGIIYTVETTSPYVGWDPILGTRYIALCVPPAIGNKWNNRPYDGSKHNQKQVKHFNRAKRMTFTRSIGYA